LDELRKIRGELAEGLQRADEELMAGLQPSLSAFERAGRRAMLQRLDADIKRLSAL
jgi:hypothetical protein